MKTIKMKASQTLIALSNWMPRVTPLTADRVKIAVNMAITMAWVAKLFGRPNNACKPYATCRPRNPIGPTVPATTAMMQTASAMVPIGPLIARSPNTG